MTDDRRAREEQRSIIRTSARRGLLWGLFWGVLTALNQPSFGRGVEPFVRSFLFFGSLVFVGTPRKTARERADDVTADLAGVTADADRARVVQSVKRIIKDGEEPADPLTRSAVLARADILRRPPALDLAALWMPAVWIAVYVGVAAHRVASGEVGKGIGTALALLVATGWLFRRWQYHRTMRRAARAYSKLVSAPSSTLEAPRSDPVGPRYRLEIKFEAARLARPVWLVFDEGAVHVLGRHFTPSNVAIRYDDVACAQEIHQKWLGATAQHQIRMLGDAHSQWLLITRRPKPVLAALQAKGVPVHAEHLNVNARELSRRRETQLDVTPHDMCRALRFDPLGPGPS